MSGPRSKIKSGNRAVDVKKRLLKKSAGNIKERQDFP